MEWKCLKIRYAAAMVQVLIACVSLSLLPGDAPAQAAEPVTSNVALVSGGTALERMLALGPEGQALTKRTGVWDVTYTSWSKPGANPDTVNGLVAERQMIGPILQEILHPASDAPGPSFTRIDYLTFNRVLSRWDYVSMDTRVPNGLMPAWSFERGSEEQIVLTFQPFAITGAGPEVRGQMLRMEQVITRQGPDHEVKDQHFILADGIGTKWLAKRYVYTRRP